MISSLLELEESTAFERWALEGLVPLTATRPHTQVKDMAHNAVRVTVGNTVVRVYAGGLREVHVDLRPLAFGAAWKVLDLLFEYSLRGAGMSGSGKRLSIREKVHQAQQAAGVCPPLSQDADLWRTLTALYSGTEEIRHSLVHRLAEVDKATGELTGRDGAGRPLTPVTAEQQEAFCRAVQRAARAALAQDMTSRERSDLAWNLDQLTNLHGGEALGGRQMQPAPLGIAPTRMRNGNLVVDVPTLLAELRQSFPDRNAYDATFALADGRHLLAELEQAPSLEVEVEPTDLPGWMEFWEGPR